MARLRSSSLLEVRRLPIAVGGLRLRRPSGLPGVGTARFPGCLIGESEERETWTAESLRAAFARGRNSPNGAVDETSAADVSGQHPCREGGRRGRGANRVLACARANKSDGPRQTL